MIAISLFLTIWSIDRTNALTGYASNYGPGNNYGNACGMQGTADPFNNWAYAAIGDTRFNDGYGCGKCWTVRCTGAYGNNPGCSCDTSKTLTIQGLDQCSECTGNHAFDLTEAAMTYLTGSTTLTGICGLISVEYERVDCSSITSNFKVRNKDGTSQFWYGMHLEDVNGDGGIRYVELLKDGRSIATCTKDQGPSFWICNGGSTLSASVPLDIKITSDLGETVTASNCITSFVGGTEMTCNTNLASGSTSGTSDTTSSTTTTSSGSASSGGKIQIQLNGNSNDYWMAVGFPNNDNSAITKLEFRDDSHSWTSGTWQNWGAYAFNDGVIFSGNQHFRVTTSSGTATSWNVFSGTPKANAGSTAYINLPGSSYTEEDDTITSTFSVAAIIAIVLLLCIVIGISGYCFIKRRKQNIEVSFESDDGDKATNKTQDGGYDMTEIEVEVNDNETTR